MKEEEDEEKAIEVLSDLLKNEVNSHIPYSLMAECYFKQNKYVEMEINLKKAMSLNINYITVYNMAVSLFYQEKYDDAIKYFLELEKTFKISLKTELEINHSILLCYLMLNNFDKVSPIIKLIETKNEDKEIGILEIADIYLVIGDYKNAIRNYEKSENYYHSVNWISEFLYCYFKEEKYDEFNLLYKKIIDKKEFDISENKNNEEFNIEYEKDLKQEIYDLEIAKKDILSNNFKIKKKFDIYIKNECCFFGCIQHNNNYNV